MNIGCYLFIGLLPSLFFFKHSGKVSAVFSILYLVPFLATGLSLIEPFDYSPIVWSEFLNINLQYYQDGLSELFLFLIAGIGCLIFAYAMSYYANDDKKLRRLCLYLQLFTVSMLSLVLADNLIVFFVSWELTTLSSFLLIQFYFQRESARDAAFKGLFVTAFGGLLLLAGFILLNAVTGSWSLHEIISDSRLSSLPLILEASFFLIFIAALTKSAQFPFYFWLPGAMQAPTPVSAFLHSATMVNAGIYLLARVHPLYAAMDFWYPALSTMGLMTLVIAAILAQIQTDLKATLAYTTLYALGSMVYLLGGNNLHVAEALVVFLVVHAFYKALLFMTIGVIDKRYGTRDSNQLIGIARSNPVLGFILIVGTLSMAGMPPFFGFIAKEFIFEAKLAGDAVSIPTMALGLIAGALIASTSFKLLINAFKKNPSNEPQKKMPLGYLAPCVLALLTLAISLYPLPIEQRILIPAAMVIQNSLKVPDVTDFVVQNWQYSLLLTVLTLILGLAFYLLNRFVVAGIKQLGFIKVLNPEKLFDGFLTNSLKFAKWITRLTHRRSLRHHLIVTFMTLLIIMVAAFVSVYAELTWASISSPSILIGLSALMFFAGGIGVVTTNKFLHVLFNLSVIGLSLALLFCFLGATDVAITQLLVEILTIVIIALSLRYSSLHYSFSRKRQLTNVLIALAVGGLFSLCLFHLYSLPFDATLSRYFIEHSKESAFGLNVVNVILVDFRAFDTLGEVFVVLGAAIGIHLLLSLKKEASMR